MRTSNSSPLFLLPPPFVCFRLHSSRICTVTLRFSLVSFWCRITLAIAYTPTEKQIYCNTIFGFTFSMAIIWSLCLCLRSLDVTENGIKNGNIHLFPWESFSHLMSMFPVDSPSLRNDHFHLMVFVSIFIYIYFSVRWRMLMKAFRIYMYMATNHSLLIKTLVKLTNCVF